MLICLGIDLDVKGTIYLNWDHFLRLNALTTNGSASKDEFIAFWLKFINPSGGRFIAKRDILKRFELLARGSYTDTATIVSTGFAKGIYDYLKSKGCCDKDAIANGGQEDDLSFLKVKKRFKSESIDLKIFNKTLKDAKKQDFHLEED